MSQLLKFPICAFIQFTFAFYWRLLGAEAAAVMMMVSAFKHMVIKSGSIKCKTVANVLSTDREVQIKCDGVRQMVYLKLEKSASPFWKRWHLCGIQRVGRIWTFRNERRGQDCQCGNPCTAEATCLEALPSTLLCLESCHIHAARETKYALICY